MADDVLSKAGSAVAGPFGSAAGSVLGGIGAWLFGDDASEAERQAWEDFIAANQSQIILDPEDYVSQYEELDPELLQKFQALQEQEILQGDTELAKLKTDPRYKDIMLEALSKYQRQADEGLTVADEADRNALMRSVAQAQQGAQGAITQQMQRRGMLGSGAELAARLASSGQDYASAAAQAEQLAKARLEAKQQALANATNLAGNMDTTEYNRAKSVADARDAINRFNVGQKSSVQQRNVAARQGAMDANTNMANNAYVSNVGTRNKQADQRKDGKIGQVNQQNQIAMTTADARLKQAGVEADNLRNKGEAIAKGASALGDTVSKYWI